MRRFRTCFPFLLTAAACLLAAGLFVLCRFAGQKEEPELPRDARLQQQEQLGKQEAQPDERLLLKVFDQKLGVFPADQGEVLFDTHIPVSDFPKEEQQRLRNGIYFHKMDDIYSYLESFSS